MWLRLFMSEDFTSFRTEHLPFFKIRLFGKNKEQSNTILKRRTLISVSEQAKLLEGSFRFEHSLNTVNIFPLDEHT
jgi:hypothetical protein